ncbi:MAG: prepilin-type N-terminal cleavage/methylation domain-containing protein [Akkermansiaceae bacterium]
MKTQKNLPPNYRGFTLIELLITIAIIAVLAVLVFGLGRKIKDKAATVTCSNNLRQISLALASYNSENQRLPGRETGMTWDRAIIPYLGFEEDRDLMGGSAFNRSEWSELASFLEVFACPSDRKDRNPNNFKRSYAIVPWTTNWSNGTSFRGWKNRPYNVGIPLSIVDDPARAAVIVEWHSGTDDGVPNHCGSGGHAYHDRGGPDGTDETVHGRNQVVLFADGHTEILPFISNSEFVRRYWPGAIGSVD